MHPTPRVIHNCSLCTNRSHTAIRKEQGAAPGILVYRLNNRWLFTTPRTVWQNSYAEHNIPGENTFQTGGTNEVNIIYQG